MSSLIYQNTSSLQRERDSSDFYNFCCVFTFFKPWLCESTPFFLRVQKWLTFIYSNATSTFINAKNMLDEVPEGNKNSFTCLNIDFAKARAIRMVFVRGGEKCRHANEKVNEYSGK